MDMQLRDKVIFVAGGSRGIGRAIAESCLSEGAVVAIAARGKAALEDTRAELAHTWGRDRVWAAAGDLRETTVINDIVARIEQELGPIWGGVANVGIDTSLRGLDLEDEVWEAGISQNLTSAYKLARAVLGPMIRRRQGSLIFISSIGGLAAYGTPLTYGASKAGMNHMAKELSVIAGAADVRVNVIAPGNIYFPGSRWDDILQGPRAQETRDWMARDCPLRRFGVPEDIGHAAAFFLSPVNAYLNGAILQIDGGQMKAV